MSGEIFHNVPRIKIPWFPTIDRKKCVLCGKCADFCHMRAFKFEEKEGIKRTVVNPNSCVVFCRGCEDICTAGAITHPSEKKTKKIIEKLKKKGR